MNHKDQQNSTPPGQLSATQLKALEALLSGHTTTSAAKIAGVDRTTIYKWKKDPIYPAFRDALDLGRRELRAAVHRRLSSLAEQAAICVENQIGHGDSKMALALLKGLGFLKPK